MTENSAWPILTLPGAADHSDPVSHRPRPANSIAIDSIPVWQHLQWNRDAVEVDIRLPIRQDEERSPVSASSFLQSSDSEEDVLSDSDEASSDPLAQKKAKSMDSKSQFPVDLDLNTRISLWYVNFM